MHRFLTAALCAASLALPSTASASVLISNLAEPLRGTTVVDNGLWAAQSFYNDPSTSQLVSIRTVLGEALDAPDVFAELRQGSTTGAVLTAFALPTLAGALSVRTLTPLSAVTLSPSETYYLIMGVRGGGSFGWSYAQGNGFVGTGGFGIYEYSTDQAGSWTNYGADNPYLMEVNVLAGAVPEPGSWLLLVVGLGGVGAVMRRGRTRVHAVARPG